MIYTLANARLTRRDGSSHRFLSFSEEPLSHFFFDLDVAFFLAGAFFVAGFLAAAFLGVVFLVVSFFVAVFLARLFLSGAWVSADAASALISVFVSFSGDLSPLAAIVAIFFDVFSFLDISTSF